MGVLSHLFSAGVGVYAGIFIAQNYEIAKVEEPSVILDKFKKYLEEVLKPKP